MNIKQKIKAMGLTILLGTSSYNANAQSQESPDSPKEPDVELKHDAPQVQRDDMSSSFARTMSFSGNAQMQNREYTYIPKSSADFHLTAEKAIKILEKTPHDANDFYGKLVSFYNQNKDKEIDLNSPLVRKTFLAFKKIVKHDGVLPASENLGKYYEQSYLLGIDAAAFLQLTQEATPNTLAFCRQLYNNENRFKMIDAKDASQAEKIAEQLLKDKLDAYHITAADTTFQYSNDFRTAVFVNDVDNEWNSWSLSLYVDPGQLNGKDGKYCPLAIQKAHELGHIMQRMPGDKDERNDLFELAPTIELIVMQDIVYKQMRGIPLEQEVQYPSSSANEVNMGKVANTFRTIKEKHGLNSYEDVLLTPEAKREINRFMTQNSSITMMRNANQKNI